MPSPYGQPRRFSIGLHLQQHLGCHDELGAGWAATYHRFAERFAIINPSPVGVNTPIYAYSYSNNGTVYSTAAPDQNTLVGSPATGGPDT